MNFSIFSLTCKSNGSGFLQRKLNHHHLLIIGSLISLLTLASLLNITGNGVRDQLVDDVLQVGGGHLAADDVDHLLADVPHLHHQE